MLSKQLIDKTLPPEPLAKLFGCGFSSNFEAHKERSSKETDDSLRKRAHSEMENGRKNAPNNFASGSPDQSFDLAVLRISSVVVGIIGVVTALALMVFSTQPVIGSLILGALSAILITGGVLGMINVIAVPIIIGAGLLVAFPMTTMGIGVII